MRLFNRTHVPLGAAAGVIVGLPEPGAAIAGGRGRQSGMRLLDAGASAAIKVEAGQ